MQYLLYFSQKKSTHLADIIRYRLHQDTINFKSISLMNIVTADGCWVITILSDALVCHQNTGLPHNEMGYVSQCKI